MDWQSRWKRIVLALSVMLLGAGLGMSCYDAYRSVEYVSFAEQLDAAMRLSTECRLRVYTDRQAALRMARRWFLAHRDEYQPRADRVQVLWHFAEAMRNEPGVIELMNIIRERDIEFAQASAGAQRLIVAALIP